MIASTESVAELRKLFFDKLKQEHRKAGNAFHSNDIERIRNSDNWLSRFINHQEGDIKEALAMLWDTCEWRKCMKVNEISEQNTCVDYLSDGSLFPYGCDKDDKVMLVFKCKMHVKGQKNFDELKRCLIYWFERLERQTNGDQITIFFDMAETGLSNMDMEFSKYLISLNKLYYPSFLNYILIFEMPWVLNAAFKIIKSWLPARAVQKIKFINKSTIKEYVNPYKMLLNWGGDDDYSFTFVPEKRIESANSSCSGFSSKSEETKKKVHFALNHSSAESSPISTAFREMRCDSPSTTSLIRIIHPDTVHFNWTGSEFVGSINVENISNHNVLYKIKTTSPDRYRVRPNSGLLQQGVSTKITVVLQNGYQVQSILKDKFLIMSMVSDREEISQQEITEIWKQSENARVEAHRLKCSLVEPAQAGVPQNNGVSPFGFPDDLVDKVEHLKNTMYQMCECHKKLHRDLSYRQNVILIILVLLVLCVVSLLFFMFKNPFINSPKSFAPSACSAPFLNEHT